MATSARFRWSLFLVVLATTAVVAMLSGPVRASGRAASSFPCRWSYSLYDGMRKGYVTAGSNADCTGRQGSLRLSIRLLRLDPMTKVWRKVKAKTKSFTHLDGNRYVEIASPCVAAAFRAVFRWTLRDTRKVIIARHLVKTPKLVVVSPNCALTLMGPGTPPKPMRPTAARRV
jgi:hypothetical protein